MLSVNSVVSYLKSIAASNSVHLLRILHHFLPWSNKDNTMPVQYYLNHWVWEWIINPSVFCYWRVLQGICCTGGRFESYVRQLKWKISRCSFQFIFSHIIFCTTVWIHHQGVNEFFLVNNKVRWLPVQKKPLLTRCRVQPYLHHIISSIYHEAIFPSMIIDISEFEWPDLSINY
jgi:hypothetical protein